MSGPDGFMAPTRTFNLGSSGLDVWKSFAGRKSRDYFDWATCLEGAVKYDMVWKNDRMKKINGGMVKGGEPVG